MHTISSNILPNKIRSKPTLTEHPLMGVDLKNLISVLKQYGGVSRFAKGHLLIFLGSALARAPFNALEHWKVRNMNPLDELESPVFIVGYWRSGTTHLHNLLGQNPEFGIITPLASGLPGQLLTLATWLEPLLERGLPDDRGVDGVAVTPDSPQEDEIPLANLQRLSIFHALYFGQHFKENFNRGVFWDGASESDIEEWKDQMLFFLAKVARHQKKQPLLIKNPVYTTRIDLLSKIWPNAKFIHIYRNPYTVYHSTVRYYQKMLQTLSLQHYNVQEIESVVQTSYPRMLNKLYRDVEHLPKNQFHEIRYESLDKQPMRVLESLYAELDLPSWDLAKNRTKSYLNKISGYKKNPHNYRSGLKRVVDDNWGSFIKKWDYSFPKE